MNKWNIRVGGAGVLSLVAVAVFALSGPAGAGVLAHWSFDEAAGPTAAEDLGKNATASGAVTFGQAGMHGSAVSLGGAAGTYLAIPYLSGIHASSYTMAAWVKPSDTGINYILSDWSNPWAFNFRVDSTVAGSHRTSSSPILEAFTVTGGVVQTGQWQHVAVTWDRASKTATAFLNGGAVGTVVSGQTNLDMINNSRGYHIGWKQDSGDTFNGSMDELWVYDQPLTARQVRNLMINNDINAATSFTGTTVYLGNLLDDAKNSTLEGAVASDTYGAAANTSRLGVAAVVQGGMNALATIAPGLKFNFATAGGGASPYGLIMNDKDGDNENHGIRTQNLDATTYPVNNVKIEEGIGFHANGLLTYDLGEIRAAGGLGADQAFLFSAKAAANDHGGGATRSAVVVADAAGKPIYGYINGQYVGIVPSGDGYEFHAGTAPTSSLAKGGSGDNVNVVLTAQARYLTLAITEGGNGIGSDHSVYQNARLELTSGAGFRPGRIPLGNLFSSPNNVTLMTALQTDTFAAVADPSKLGVAAKVLGLSGSKDITGTGVQFDFASAGGDSSAWNDIYNDAFSNGSSGYYGLRTTGLASPSLPLGVKIEDGIGMHANALVSFDLDEIRAAGGFAQDAQFRFTTKAGQEDDQPTLGSMHAVAILVDRSGNVVTGYVDGVLQPLTQTGGVYSFTGTMPQAVGAGRFVNFDVLVGGDIRFLALGFTGAGNGIGSDHGVFSEAVLSHVPEPVTMGLLACGLAGLGGYVRRRRTR